jgi:hypothetical protein
MRALEVEKFLPERNLAWGRQLLPYRGRAFQCYGARAISSAGRLGRDSEKACYTKVEWLMLLLKSL